MRPATRHLGHGVRATLRHLPLVALQASVDLTASLAALLPAVVAAVLVVRHAVTLVSALPPTRNPLALAAAELLGYLLSARFLMPVVGLAAAGALLVAMMRVLYLTGALGLLAGDLRAGGRAPAGGFMDAVVARFPAALAVVALMGVAGLAVAGLVAGLVGAAGAVFAAGPSVASAAGLALAGSLTVVLLAIFEAVRHLALVRTVALGEGPGVATYEAGALVLRRPGTLLALGVLLLGVELAVAVIFASATGMQGLLPAAAAATGWAVGARVVGEVTATVALAVVGVVAWGALVSLALDDAGALPPDPEPAPRSTPPAPAPAVPARRVSLARPVSEVWPPAPAPQADAPGDDASDDDPSA